MIFFKQTAANTRVVHLNKKYTLKQLGQHEKRISRETPVDHTNTNEWINLEKLRPFMDDKKFKYVHKWLLKKPTIKIASCLGWTDPCALVSSPFVNVASSSSTSSLSSFLSLNSFDQFTFRKPTSFGYQPNQSISEIKNYELMYKSRQLLPLLPLLQFLYLLYIWGGGENLLGQVEPGAEVPWGQVPQEAEQGFLTVP